MGRVSLFTTNNDNHIDHVMIQEPLICLLTYLTSMYLSEFVISPFPLFLVSIKGSSVYVH